MYIVVNHGFTEKSQRNHSTLNVGLLIVNVVEGLDKYIQNRHVFYCQVHEKGEKVAVGMILKLMFYGSISSSSQWFCDFLNYNIYKPHL